MKPWSCRHLTQEVWRPRQPVKLTNYCETSTNRHQAHYKKLSNIFWRCNGRPHPIFCYAPIIPLLEYYYPYGSYIHCSNRKVVWTCVHVMRPMIRIYYVVTAQSVHWNWRISNCHIIVNNSLRCQMSYYEILLDESHTSVHAIWRYFLIGSLATVE